MVKTLNIDGKEVKFKASAAIPRLYRMRLGRDVLKDLDQLKAAYVKNLTEEEQLSIIDLEIFENIAYIMAKHAAPDEISNSIEDWLDNFETFSIYQILEELLDLWVQNESTQVESKKKLSQVAGK